MVPWREKVLWLEIFKTRQDQSEYKGAWVEPLAGNARGAEAGQGHTSFSSSFSTEMLL